MMTGVPSSAMQPASPRPQDAMVLALLATEWQNLLTGASLQKILHLSHREWVLSFRRKDAAPESDLLGRQVKLVLNLKKVFPCVGVFSAETDVSAFTHATFAKPTSDVLLLRKHLGGGRLEQLEALPGERVLVLTFSNRNELGHPTRWQWVLELTGKHSNWLLVDEPTHTIAGCAHNVTEAMSQHRQISVGALYVPPPVPEQTLWLGQASTEDMAQALSQWHANTPNAAKPWQRFFGAGKHTWQNVLAWHTQHGMPLPQAAAYLHHWANGNQGQIVLSPEGFALQPATEPSTPFANTVAFGQYLIHTLTQQQCHLHRQRLHASVTRQQQRLNERLRHQGHTTETDGPEPVSPETLQHWGDVVMTHASQHPPTTCPESDTLTLLDWDTNAPITLTVDPERTLNDNAQRLYRQAQKQRQREHEWAHIRAQLAEQQRQLAELAWQLDQAETLPQLASLEKDLVTAGVVAATKCQLAEPELRRKSKARKAETADDTPPNDKVTIAGLLAFTASDGETVIHVGRQGEANSALLSKLSRPTDWWCHAKDYPGAHVVIHHPDPSDELLLDGLHLACHFSGGSTSGKLPIVYTQRRYVRKIPNSTPGHVTYTHETEALITADADRIARLTAT